MKKTKNPFKMWLPWILALIFAFVAITFTPLGDIDNFRPDHIEVDEVGGIDVSFFEKFINTSAQVFSVRIYGYVIFATGFFVGWGLTLLWRRYKK